MTTVDPLTRREPLSALAILRGHLPTPDPRRDRHPFAAWVTYVRSRCLPWSAPPHTRPDATEDCYYDDGLRNVFTIAWQIALELRLKPLNVKHSLLNTTLARVEALRDMYSKMEHESLRKSLAEYYTPTPTAIAIEHRRLRQHCNLALAETGDRDALAFLVEDAEVLVQACDTRYLPFAVGARSLLANQAVGTWQGPPLGVIQSALDLGRGSLADHARLARGAEDRAAHDEADVTGMDDDRAGIVRHGERTGLQGIGAAAAEPVAVDPPSHSVVVFREDIHEAAGKGDNQRVVKQFLGDARGARLPLVPVPADWDAWEAGLVAESPWLAPFIRAVRASQGGRSHWGGGAVCAVGGPGAGKTRNIRRIAEVSGLPFARFQCDASSDNSGLGGTSIRWLSAHPGLAERLLSSAMRANGLVLLDEIEKAAGTRRNGGGDPHDIMHGLFEPETAKAWKSPYLLSEIDVSNVLYLCTANDVSTVPSSLLDRMRVIRVSEPGPEHLGLLAPSLAREACRELGLDERWGTLDGEEMGVLADVWRGGSIRRLGRLVDGLLLARDGAPVARH